MRLRSDEENKKLYESALFWTKELPFTNCKRILVLSGKLEIKSCKSCDNILKDFARTFCSRDCANSFNISIKDYKKIEEDKRLNNLEKYGVEHSSQRKSTRQKLSSRKTEWHNNLSEVDKITWTGKISVALKELYKNNPEIAINRSKKVDYNRISLKNKVTWREKQDEIGFSEEDGVNFKKYRKRCGYFTEKNYNKFKDIINPPKLTKEKRRISPRS